jgi:hypothetical protein
VFGSATRGRHARDGTCCLAAVRDGCHEVDGDGSAQIGARLLGSPDVAMRVDRERLNALNDLQRRWLPRVSPHVRPASKMQIEPQQSLVAFELIEVEAAVVADRVACHLHLPGA